MKLRSYSFLVFALGGLSLLLNSCAAPKALEYRDFKNFTVDRVGFSSTSLKMDLVYYNPNNFGLQLKSTDLDVFLNNVLLGHTILEYQVGVPKLQEFVIPIKIDVDMQNLLKNSLITLLNNEVTVRVTGSIKVGKANIFKSFPVLYEGKQKFVLF